MFKIEVEKERRIVNMHIYIYIASGVMISKIALCYIIFIFRHIIFNIALRELYLIIS